MKTPDERRRLADEGYAPALGQVEPAVVAFARKAPSRMAGKMRYPSSNTAANARPVGGQMGVALGLIEASNKPALAHPK